MQNVLDMTNQESQLAFDFEDEKIASNLYLVSLSESLRGLDGRSETEKITLAEKNNWLLEETEHIKNVPVLSFDNIVKKLKNRRTSCDAFFYNFTNQPETQHYLAEFKNSDKATLLSLLIKSNNDGIFNKINDSVFLIQSELEFGGVSEHEDIIKNTHFFLVYGGKNNVATNQTITMPRKTKIQADSRGKQKHASRMKPLTQKQENEAYSSFGKKITDLGLACCDASIFPGKALPQAIRHGKSKIRNFSIFSASDFAQVVDAGFFDEWNWGEYTPFLYIQQ